MRSSFFSCGPSPLFPIHLPDIALLCWRLVATFFSFVLSACCHCFFCLHALFSLLFVSFFRPSTHYSVFSLLTSLASFSWAFICLCGFSYELSCSLPHGRSFFHAGNYCSVLISLAVFPTACFLPSLGHYSSGCDYILFSGGCCLSLAPLFFRCAYFLFGCAYCLSILGCSPLHRFFTLSSLVCGSLLRLLVPASSRFLPSPLIRVGVPLLPSYFSFFSLPTLS